MQAFIHIYHFYHSQHLQLNHQQTTPLFVFVHRKTFFFFQKKKISSDKRHFVLYVRILKNTAMCQHK